MDTKTLVDITGWLGALLLLTAYGAVSMRKMQGDSIPYQILNLAGGACLIVNTLYYGAYPSSVVNIVWIGIALVTMARRRD